VRLVVARNYHRYQRRVPSYVCLLIIHGSGPLSPSYPPPWFATARLGALFSPQHNRIQRSSERYWEHQKIASFHP
jgi:hypothetical protein